MKLKEIRKSKHFTQQDIAEKLNCDVTTYARYENGDRNPPLEMSVLQRRRGCRNLLKC